MIIEAIDGMYLIVAKDYDLDEPSIPADLGATELAIETCPDIAYVLVGRDDIETVDLHVNLRASRPSHIIDAADNWDSLATAVLHASSALEARTLEHAPCGHVTHTGGSFALHLLSRVTREQRLETPDEVRAEHLLLMWPS